MLDDLVVERIFPENYGTAQVNVKILKRDRKQVLLVKPSYTARTRPSRPTKTRSDQVRLYFHRSIFFWVHNFGSLSNAPLVITVWQEKDR